LSDAIQVFKQKNPLYTTKNTFLKQKLYFHSHLLLSDVI